MTAEYPLCHAEERAVDATRLSAFPINLKDVRRNVDLILTQFGRHGFFDEYTVHNFSHCYEMLRMLDWVIPDDGKKAMSSGDWLMITLCAYFHDLGLLITRDEFKQRAESDFLAFCEQKLFAGPEGADYREKIDLLQSEERERFLYAEFVRAHHGPRVRSWVDGKFNETLGLAKDAAAEIDQLLSKLDPAFRRDLAIICESHNLDDLGDVKKYKTSQPYGNSESETVNLQYSAVLLRTIDLFQITDQRAPSTLYRIINPTDPVSQREWVKQNAVKRVRPRMGFDREGNQSEKAPKDTIEVFGHFADENGFFGLTSYLTYAKAQLTKSYEVIERSRRSRGSPHAFPWRSVDDENIEAEGFLKQTFGFELDQAKILDLLTGHTLYNDSNVVLRELTQNALDAIRLFCHIAGSSPHEGGRVEVSWDSKKAELEILDNGTGMSQEIIEKHLLKVGASRYQDKQFKAKYPTFSPISRFGIGVLSTFMIADSVQILTVAPEEDEARQISLRSVHGKYLIKLLNKQTNSEARRIGEHGTIVRLRVRSSARAVDVLDAMRRWIVIPACNVSVRIDNSEPITVGYPSVKRALEEYISNSRITRYFDSVKVMEMKADGCDLAIALGWSQLFRDWSFVSADLSGRDEGDSGFVVELCTCVEGVAVEYGTPGFRGPTVLALANATGAGAPKTNVARSSLEETRERKELLRKIYQLYATHIISESQRLISEEHYSSSWAVSQIPWLIGPLMGGRGGSTTNAEELSEAMADVPMYLVESEGNRQVISLRSLNQIGGFWTIESILMESAERLIKETETKMTTLSLLKVCKPNMTEVPKGVILCNREGGFAGRRNLRGRYEIQEIDILG
jgi:hypothetical protein